MKKLLAAAIAAAIVSPVVAAADSNNVTVYGQVKLALTNFDREVGPSDWSISEQSGASLLGFKGTEDLGNGLKAIWKMEFDVPIGRNTGTVRGPLNGGGAVNSTRNAYIGLAGDFGTFLVGRHDSPYKVAFGKFDLFPDTVADFNAGDGLNNLFHDVRVQDTLVYISPSFSGLTVAGAIITGSGSENNFTAASTDDEEIAQHYSLGAMYENNGIMASLGYEFLNGATLQRPNNDDDEKWGAALGYKGNNFYVGARYEDRDAIGGFGGLDSQSWQLGASYTMGNTVFKGAYGEIDLDVTNGSITPSSWVIGVDHNLSKRTQVFALYIDADDDTSLPTAVDASAFSVGMSHKF